MVFFATLLLLSVVFSAVCSFTSVGPRGKRPLDMTEMDIKLLNGTATLGERLFLFAMMIPAGLIFIPNVIAAAIVYAIYKFVVLMLR